MQFLPRFSVIVTFFLAMPGLTAPARAQLASGQEHAPGAHQHPAEPPAEHSGQAATAAQRQGLTLADLEKMALDKNPTLAQAAAEVRAASGRKLQAGLYPNPVIGATGDENSPGPVIRGGEFGGFFEQRIVTAGKLRLSRDIAAREEEQAGAGADAQRYKVLNTVRVLYYEALAAAQLVGLRSELARIAGEAVKISGELANVGQADQPDVLEAEVEAQRAEVELATAEYAQRKTWHQLAAVVGDPSLPIAPLAGDLEDVPRQEMNSALTAILNESPEIRMSEIKIARGEAALKRAQVEKIPDIVARGGVRYNRELLEAGGRPVGVEGFFDVGIRIPIFDRNQGAVAAAKADLDRARLDAERVKLSLRSRLAAVYQDYQTALNLTEKYRDQLLPRAQKAYDLYLNSFRQMAAAYPQVLIAQRNLFQLREEYIRRLADAWKAALEIQGLLLTGGLEAPGMSMSTPAMPGGMSQGMADGRVGQ